MFARLTQQPLPRGFKLVEVAVCVDEKAKHTFSPEYDMLEFDLQISRSRIDRYCANTLPERFDDDVRLHGYRLEHLKHLKQAGADILLDISAQYVFASTPLTPQDVLSAMAGYRHIDFVVDTGRPDEGLGRFFVNYGIFLPIIALSRTYTSKVESLSFREPAMFLRWPCRRLKANPSKNLLKLAPRSMTLLLKRPKTGPMAGRSR